MERSGWSSTRLPTFVKKPGVTILPVKGIVVSCKYLKTVSFKLTAKFTILLTEGGVKGQSACPVLLVDGAPVE